MSTPSQALAQLSWAKEKHLVCIAVGSRLKHRASAKRDSSQGFVEASGCISVTNNPTREPRASFSI
jgi:hypothetical protein